ncbi:ATP-binding protein [Amycolatopsis balhimycina]|uniref:ATP-binding protein n=1 Tax=Amycolatopsis TaxID=1813 RepID=UPI00039EF30E|nr:LuxR family transcriptional regulator [Amycolatopsis balhimycina]
MDRNAGFGRGFAFVGRRHELGQLVDAVRRAPAVVVVEGDAGMGKSRLVREATTILEREGWRVVTGFCHPLREPLPYGPVVEALRKVGPWLPGAELPPTAGALAPLLPDLAGLLPPAPPTPDDPGVARHQLIQAVRSVLASLGRVIVVVEDLHWVDDATRELLVMLARDLPDHLALVLTWRAEDRSCVLGGACRPTVIRLAPLTETDVAELAGAVLGARATPELCAVLHRRSEGLPLVAEEDLLTFRHQERQDAAALEHADVPLGLRAAITERLVALSPAGAAVVDAAAVLAVPATEALLTEIAGLDPEQGAQGLIDVLDAAVLREAGTGRYGFRHVLAQQVAYRHIPGPCRIRLHRRAVEVFETHDPAPLVQVAHHTLAAGDHETWLVRVEQAADQAVALGDTGTAATLLRQILNRQDIGADRRSRAALGLARIASAGVDYAATASVLTAVLADHRLPEEVRGEIRLGLGLIMLNLAGDPAGFCELERAVEELGTLPRKAARAMIALALNEYDGAAAHAWEWLDRAEQAVRDSTDETDEPVRTDVQVTRLMLMARAGDPAVWPLVDRLPRRDAAEPVLRRMCQALYNLSEAALQLGHDRRARGLMLESQDLAARTENAPLECLTRVRLLRTDWLAGRWVGLDEQYDVLCRAYPDVRQADLDRALYRGHLALAQGKHSQALEHFAAAGRGRETSEADVSMSIAAGLTAVRLAQNDPRAAWASAEPAVTMLRRLGSWTRTTGLVPVAVEAALAGGHREEAERLVADAARGVRDRDAPAATAELELAAGLLARDSAPATAAEHFATARAAWQDIGRPYHAAQAAEQLANALVRSCPEDAAAHLTEAAHVHSGLGAIADAMRCQHTLRALGVEESARRGRRGYGDELSPRELEVAELLSRSATNADIAETLFLSPRTVEKHVARILAKLGTDRKGVRTTLAPSTGIDPVGRSSDTFTATTDHS